MWRNIYLTAVTAVAVAKLVILGISFLISLILGLREALVAKLVILGVLLLTSFIFALKASVVAKLVISGISSSISLILALHMSFLTSFLSTTSLNFLNQQEQVLTYEHLIQISYQYLIYQSNLSTPVAFF